MNLLNIFIQVFFLLLIKKIFKFRMHLFTSLIYEL